MCINWNAIRCCLHSTGSLWTRLEYELVEGNKGLPRYPKCQSRTCYQECSCHLFNYLFNYLIKNFTLRETIYPLPGVSTDVFWSTNWNSTERSGKGTKINLFRLSIEWELYSWFLQCYSSLTVFAWVKLLPSSEHLRYNGAQFFLQKFLLPLASSVHLHESSDVLTPLCISLCTGSGCSVILQQWGYIR